MSRDKLSPTQTKQILELYKSHYNRKETADLTNVSYAMVVTLYRSFVSFGIEKYNRFNLIPEETFNTIFKEVSNG